MEGGRAWEHEAEIVEKIVRRMRRSPSLAASLQLARGHEALDANGALEEVLFIKGILR